MPEEISKIISKELKSFTRDNARGNLKILTEISPPKNVHAHHIFPIELNDRFLSKGINIHDPKYLTWWEKSPHLSKAGGYNAQWKEFFRAYPNATQEQVLEFGKKLMAKEKLPTNY